MLLSSPFEGEFLFPLSVLREYYLLFPFLTLRYAMPVAIHTLIAVNMTLPYSGVGFKLAVGGETTHP
jgi:hypothetical protein